MVLADVYASAGKLVVVVLLGGEDEDFVFAVSDDHFDCQYNLIVGVVRFDAHDFRAIRVGKLCACAGHRCDFAWSDLSYV